MHFHGPGHLCRDTLPLRYFQINPFLAVRANGRVIDDRIAETGPSREAVMILRGIFFSVLTEQNVALFQRPACDRSL